MKNIIYFIVISTILLINSCIEEPPNALITGVGGVVTDLNNNPLESVEVSVGSKKVLTDKKGYYIIDGVISGNIGLTAVKQGYVKYNYSVTSTNGVITKQNIKLIKLGSIVGKVTGNNGDGIEGVKISTIPATEEVNTDANGNYTIADLTSGNYTLKAEKVGFANKTKEVTVIDGQTTNGDITVLTLGKIAGKVTGADGDGIEGVKISTTPATEEVNTDANGNYTIADLTAGNYTVKAEKNGYYTSSKQVTVIEGAETENNFTLYLEGTVPEGMVIVEGGTFQMGSTSGDSDEQPVHSVTLSNFYISKYEVTHAEYLEFLNGIGVSSNGNYEGEEYIDMDDPDCAIGHNGTNFYFKGSNSASTENTPVIEVSWYGAKAYCEWKGGRLPTEAEWEYACRGGIHSASNTYSGSDNIDDVAWYNGNSGSKTHEVGTKSPNELGIYDMSGNVWEWCNDWYSSSYYGSSPSNDPRGPNSGTYRVLRGGSWNGYAINCRSANRDGSSPGLSYFSLGFRIARTP